MAEVFFALDTSASTSSVGSYWRRVEEVFNKYKGLGKGKIRYFSWDAKIQELTETQVVREITKKCSINGPDTLPSQIAKKIIELDFHGKLVLVTDGQISQIEVKKTDDLIKDWDLSEVDVELISSRIDLSVTAPFTRSTIYTIKHNGMPVGGGASNVVLDLANYNTVAKFLEGYETLYSIVVSQNMGKMNDGLRDGLLGLQKALLAECAKSNEEGAGNSTVIDLLHSGDYVNAVIATKAMATVSLSNDTPSEIQAKIQKLIVACTSPGSYSLSLLDNGRVQRADDTKAVGTEQVEALDTSRETFECPIYYENDVPALLVGCVSPILDGESKEIVDLLCNCPLFLLNFPHLIEKVKDAIDHPIGCNSIKIRNGVFEESPMTRREIMGAIPLGVDKSHVKAGNWTISRLFTGGKMIGNMQLWFTVVYYIAKHHIGYLSDNKDLMDSFHLQFVSRMEKYTSYMGLSGLPEYPLIRVPVGQAVWYCVASADIYAETNVEQDRLRAFVSIARIFTEILDELAYPYDKAFTAERLKLFTCFNYLMANKFDFQKTKDLIRAQYQNHMYLDSLETYVFLDGTLAQGKKTAPALPAQLAAVPLPVLLYFAKQVNPQLKTSTFVIPRIAPTLPIPDATHHYIYREDYIKVGVDICPATLRPYCIVDDKEWEVCAENKFGKVEKLISFNRHYLAYIETKGKLPTFDDLILFVANREAQSIRQRDTLPICITEIHDDIETSFQKAFKELRAHLGKSQLSIEDITKRGQLAASKIARREIELKWLTNTYEKTL